MQEVYSANTRETQEYVRSIYCPYQRNTRVCRKYILLISEKYKSMQEVYSDNNRETQEYAGSIFC